MMGVFKFSEVNLLKIRAASGGSLDPEMKHKAKEAVNS